MKNKFDVIGDIHGCGEEFGWLLGSIDRILEPKDTHLVLLGDHLAKGPRPDLVIGGIIDRRRFGGRVTLLCGNHELRFLEAAGRIRAGTPRAKLSRSEQDTIALLEEECLLECAVELMEEASRTIQYTGMSAFGPWTAVHGGIDPDLGLDETSDHDKIHMKTRRGEPNWWERYDGSDGLVICGHKPQPEPVLRRDCRDRPTAINLDTGCIYGGHLTAYHVERDRLFQVRSRQPIDRERLEFAVSPTVAPSEAPAAWDAPGRTYAS